MKKRLAWLCLCGWLAAGGCGVGTISSRQQDRETQNRQIYELYRQYLETLNENRQHAGVSPLPVRSYEEWRQSPGTN